MGHRQSRELDYDDKESKGCRRGLFPCWHTPRENRSRTSLPNVLGCSTMRTDLFQSCDDLAASSMQVVNQDHVLQLRASLNAMRQLQLPEGAEEVSRKIQHDLAHFEAILKGKDTSKFTGHDNTPPVQAQVASASASPKEKPSWKNVVSQVQQANAMAPALNDLLKILWPRIGTYVQDLLTNSIEPSINASLPGLMKGGVKFTKVSLGDSSPLLGPLWVELNDNGAIEFHMGLNMQSDLDVELTVMGLTVGINQFILKGKLVMLMDPPMEKPPFFGGLQVYFPNPPEISLNFVGAARVADLPMLRGAVRNAVDGAVAGACVLPRRIAVDMNEEDEIDLIDLSYPEPIGILRLTLWCGKNLVAADRSLFGTATSDPYVVASLGIKNWTSPTIKKTLDPVWGDGQGLSFDFPVHDDCQEVTLKVFDYDFGSSDDLIGVAKREEVKALIAKQGKQVLALLKENGEPGAGSLTISATFLNLVAAKPAKSLAVPTLTQAHLSVKVLTVTGLESGAEYPFRVRIQVIMPDGPSSNAPSIASNSSVRSGSQASKPTLKKSKSMTPADTQGRVLIEELTNPSHPKEQKELAEALRGIALHLRDKNNDIKEIAEILNVSGPQVERFLEETDEKDKKSLKAQEEAIKEKMSVQHPRFDEVLQMLLPAEACHELTVVELAVIDKRQSIIGTATLAMSQLLQAQDLNYEGPFQCADSTGVAIVAKTCLRWLD